MPDPIDRFLRHRPTIPSQRPLGRVYGVTRQSWSLDVDPKKVAPERLIVAADRTAAEAADIARTEAMAMSRNGFHKPSGAWWGVEDGRFHRFVVARRSPRKAAIVAAAGMAGVAVFALIARGRRS